jgi:hypothetical protein
VRVVGVKCSMYNGHNICVIKGCHGEYGGIHGHAVKCWVMESLEWGRCLMCESKRKVE